jgi:hypothetical protein
VLNVYPAPVLVWPVLSVTVIKEAILLIELETVGVPET